MESKSLEEMIAPFYLNMMGLNALSAPMELLTEVVETGRLLSAVNVVELLRDSWRPLVMGAWFSLLQDDDTVNEALLQALSSSLGSLTSPPLSVAAIVLTGAKAVPFLQEYLRRDLEFSYGASGFVSAALEHLGDQSHPWQTQDRDRGDFLPLLNCAEWIKSNRSR